MDENEPEMLYDAIHHAREPMAMQQLISTCGLLENYDTDSEVQAIVDTPELYFIPFLILMDISTTVSKTAPMEVKLEKKQKKPR